MHTHTHTDYRNMLFHTPYTFMSTFVHVHTDYRNTPSCCFTHPYACIYFHKHNICTRTHTVYRNTSSCCFMHPYACIYFHKHNICTRTHTVYRNTPSCCFTHPYACVSFHEFNVRKIIKLLIPYPYLHVISTYRYAEGLRMRV